MRARARGARRAEEDFAHRRRRCTAARSPERDVGRIRISSAAACRRDEHLPAGRAHRRSRRTRARRRAHCARRPRWTTSPSWSSSGSRCCASTPSNPIYRRLRPDAPARARRLFAAQLRLPERGDLPRRAEGVAAVGILRCVASAGLPLLFPARHGYISSVYVVPPRAGGRAACALHRRDWLVPRPRTPRGAAPQRLAAPRKPEGQGASSGRR